MTISNRRIGTSLGEAAFDVSTNALISEQSSRPTRQIDGGSQEAVKAGRLSQIVDSLLPQGEPVTIEGDPEVVAPNWFKVDDPQVWYHDDKEPKVGPQVQSTSAPAAITPRKNRTRPSTEAMKSGTVIPVGLGPAADALAMVEGVMELAPDMDDEYRHLPPDVPPAVTPTPSKRPSVRRSSVLPPKPTQEPEEPQRPEPEAARGDAGASGEFNEPAPDAGVVPDESGYASNEYYSSDNVLDQGSLAPESPAPEVAQQVAPEATARVSVHEWYEAEGVVARSSSATPDVHQPSFAPLECFMPPAEQAVAGSDQASDESALRPMVTVVPIGDLPPAIVPDERPIGSEGTGAMPVHIVPGRGSSSPGDVGFDGYAPYEPGALSMPAPAPEAYLPLDDDAHDYSPIYGQLRSGDTDGVAPVELERSAPGGRAPDSSYSSAGPAVMDELPPEHVVEDFAETSPWAPEPSVLETRFTHAAMEPELPPAIVPPDLGRSQRPVRANSGSVVRAGVNDPSRREPAPSAPAVAPSPPATGPATAADEFVLRVAEVRNSGPKAPAAVRVASAQPGSANTSSERTDGVSRREPVTEREVLSDAERPMTRRQARIRDESADGAREVADPREPLRVLNPGPPIQRKVVLKDSPFTDARPSPRPTLSETARLDTATRPLMLSRPESGAPSSTTSSLNPNDSGGIPRGSRSAPLRPQAAAPPASSSASAEVQRMGRRAARLAEEQEFAARRSDTR